MKYGFYINQLKAVELGLTFQQTLLITCINDLIPIPKFEKNEKHEVFITHSIFLEEYPLLGFKDRTVFFRKFKELEELGFITKTTERIGGNKTKNYYGITEKSAELFLNSGNVVFLQHGNVVKKQHNHYTNINILNKYIDICNNCWGKKFRTPSKELKAIVKLIEEEIYTFEDFEHVVKVANVNYLNEKENKDYRNLVSPFRKNNFENLLNLPLPRNKELWEDYTANQFLELYHSGEVDKQTFKKFKNRKIDNLPLCKGEYK